MSEDRRDPRQFDEMLRRVASDAARQAVAEGVQPIVEATLQRLGMDTVDPIKMQRHMAYLGEAAARAADPEARKDWVFMRETRLRCEKVQEAALSTGVRIAVGGVGTLLLLGLGVWVKGQI